MEQQDLPRSRLVAAAITLLLLTFAGVVWLGFSQEMLRTEVAALGRSLGELPREAPSVEPSPDMQALTAAVAKLSAKVDALAAADAAKAVSRLSGEVKTLAGRVEALTGRVAALATAKSGKGRKAGPPTPETPEAPRPFFGPGYPAWPGY